MTKTKDERISKALKDNGAFFAFTEEQFEEQKKEGEKYASVGFGLICPADNVKELSKEIERISKEEKKKEREAIQKRIKELGIEKLPKEERIKNRIILISEAVSRIQNYMDCMELQEAIEELRKAEQANIKEALDYLIICINYRYHDRPEVEDVYRENLKIIKELKKEIENLL